MTKRPKPIKLKLMKSTKPPKPPRVTIKQLQEELDSVKMDLRSAEERVERERITFNEQIQHARLMTLEELRSELRRAMNQFAPVYVAIDQIKNRLDALRDAIMVKPWTPNKGDLLVVLKQKYRAHPVGRIVECGHVSGDGVITIQKGNAGLRYNRNQLRPATEYELRTLRKVPKE